MQTSSSTQQPAKRVYFHVGAPKTGTTYLQHVLYRNRESLARDGVLYPYDEFDDSLRSALDLRGIGWGGREPDEYAGAWETVAGRCRAWPGSTVIVSNELLGGATAERIKAGVDSVQPADVHVLFSARDLARQLVSDWQEHIKHRHQVPLERFVDDLVELGLEAPAPFGEMFWGLHDAVRVLGRWAETVPPANIHVVTVPQPGGPADTLWRRFCTVTGLDPEAYDTEGGRANASMGVVETELVRRINARIPRLDNQHYDQLVRIQLAENILGRSSPALRLAPQHSEWVQQRSRQLIDELESAGYQIEGDLEELMPARRDVEDYLSPTDLGDGDLAPAAIRATAGMLRHASRQQRRIEDLRQRADDLGRRVAELETPHSSRELVTELYRRIRRRVGALALARLRRRD